MKQVEYNAYEIANSIYVTVDSADTLSDAIQLMRDYIRHDYEFYGDDYEPVGTYHIFKTNTTTGERLDEVVLKDHMYR